MIEKMGKEKKKSKLSLQLDKITVTSPQIYKIVE